MRTGILICPAASFWGVVVLLPLLAGGSTVERVLALSPRALAAIGYMGVCASGLGYVLYNVSIERIGPTRTASVVYSLLPVLVAALAWAAFDEPVTPLLAASVVVIVLGLNLSTRASGREDDLVGGDAVRPDRNVDGPRSRKS